MSKSGSSLFFPLDSLPKSQGGRQHLLWLGSFQQQSFPQTSIKVLTWARHFYRYFFFRDKRQDIYGQVTSSASCHILAGITPAADQTPTAGPGWIGQLIEIQPPWFDSTRTKLSSSYLGILPHAHLGGLWGKVKLLFHGGHFVTWIPHKSVWMNHCRSIIV